MKRYRLLMLVGFVLIASSPHSQSTGRVFKNCTELNKGYPGGVGLPGAVNVGGATKKLPKYNKALYLANQKSDRDKDGIACEK